MECAAPRPKATTASTVIHAMLKYASRKARHSSPFHDQNPIEANWVSACAQTGTIRQHLPARRSRTTGEAARMHAEYLFWAIAYGAVLRGDLVPDRIFRARDPDLRP